MNGNLHIVSFRLIRHGLFGISKPQQFLLAVTSANIRHQINRCRNRRIGHSVRCFRIAGNFDCDGLLVVHTAGETVDVLIPASSPSAVFFLHAQTFTAVFADDIVCRAVGGSEVIATLLCGPLPDDTVGGDGVHVFFTRACLVL